ncbi:DUF835 domain-containing protein [Candidatus Altiarchaeota archaeon]
MAWELPICLTVCEIIAAEILVLVFILVRLFQIWWSRREVIRLKVLVFLAGVVFFLLVSNIFEILSREDVSFIQQTRFVVGMHSAEILAFLILGASVLGPFTRPWRMTTLTIFYLNILLLLFAANHVYTSAIEAGTLGNMESGLVYMHFWILVILGLVLAGMSKVWAKTRLKNVFITSSAFLLLFISQLCELGSQYGIGFTDQEIGLVCHSLHLIAYALLGFVAIRILHFKELSLDQRHFRVAYMPEDIGSKAERKYKVGPGHIYLLKEERPDKGFEIFKDQAIHGFNGLCISRTHPDKIRDRYDLQKTPLLWLNDSHRDIVYTIQPKLEQIYAVLEEFVSQAGTSVVLLDGIEYLIQRNKFEMVLHFLSRLRDIITESESRVIIPFSPRALKKRELNLLEKETDILEL